MLVAPRAGAGLTTSPAWAALPPPIISDLHVTNFDPFTGPPAASIRKVLI